MTEGPSWASYSAKKNAFYFDCEGITDESLIGEYYAILNFNAQKETYAGSYFGVPNTVDLSDFIQEVNVTIILSDIAQGLGLNAVSINEDKQIRFEFDEPATLKSEISDEDLFYEIFESYEITDYEYNIALTLEEMTSDYIIVNSIGHSTLYAGKGATLKIQIASTSAYRT